MAGWILSIITQIIVLYGLSPYLDEETAPVIDPFFRVIYGVFHRTMWSITIAWIIFVCAKGYGGIISKIDLLYFYTKWSKQKQLRSLRSTIFLVLLIKKCVLQAKCCANAKIIPINF